MVRQLRTGEGTAIGDAILLAARIGKKQKAVDGVVPPTTALVISDGARDGGRVAPLVAAAAGAVPARRAARVNPTIALRFE